MHEPEHNIPLRLNGHSRWWIAIPGKRLSGTVGDNCWHGNVVILHSMDHGSRFSTSKLVGKHIFATRELFNFFRLSSRHLRSHTSYTAPVREAGCSEAGCVPSAVSLYLRHILDICYSLRALGFVSDKILSPTKCFYYFEGFFREQRRRKRTVFQLKRLNKKSGYSGNSSSLNAGQRLPKSSMARRRNLRPYVRISGYAGRTAVAAARANRRHLGRTSLGNQP
jgi:hypothetical protein